MTTYKLIIKNKFKTDENFFLSNYKPDPNIKWYIRLSFMIMVKEKLDVKNKYKTFFELLNGFLIKDHKDEFIDYFCNIQKTYNIINRLIYNYKYKKSKIVVNTDMGLNELSENGKNVICILDNNSRYLFNINDLIKIIEVSLTNSYMFFSQPKSIKNPYNNVSFNKSTLYNIYFFVRYKTNYYPELLFKFFQCDYNLTNFKYLNEHLLRDYSIQSYVYKTPCNTIHKEIINMIYNFNRIKKLIRIHEEFPQKDLVEIMRPYLFLYFKSQYSFHPEVKKRYYCYFKESLLKFHKFNPQFGRKKIKLLYKVRNNFKKRISGKEIYFDDNCVKFLNVEKLNDKFLTDHLKYTDIVVFNSNSDSEDEEDEDNEYQEEEDNEYQEEEEEEEEEDDSDSLS